MPDVKDQRSRHRGEGHGHLTIHREGRVAELPLIGSHRHLDADLVRGLCEKLGLTPPDLLKGRGEGAARHAWRTAKGRIFSGPLLQFRYCFGAVVPSTFSLASS